MILEVIMILTKGFDTYILIYSYIDSPDVSDGQNEEIYLSITQANSFSILIVTRY